MIFNFGPFKILLYSAYDFLCKKFPSRADDPRVLFESESIRREWRPSAIFDFWKTRRWRIPVSQDSELEPPITPTSDTDRESVTDADFVTSLANSAL